MYVYLWTCFTTRNLTERTLNLNAMRLAWKSEKARERGREIGKEEREIGERGERKREKEKRRGGAKRTEKRR